MAVCNGLPTNTLPITILPPPALTGISPAGGYAGTTLTLTGTGLSSCTTVSLGGTQVASTATATSITATLPTETQAGYIPVYAICGTYRIVPVWFLVHMHYDNGTVALTVNGVTESVPYALSQNSTSAAATASLISAINADPNAYVNATANGSTGISLASKDPGAAADFTFSLVDNYDTWDFSAPSFASTPSSGTLTGGNNATVTTGVTIYSYSVPSPGTATTGYDPDGNLLSYTDSVMGTPLMGTWSFGYDPLNRLTSAAVSSGYYNNEANLAVVTLGWSYDEFGNRLTQSSNSGALPTGSTQFAGANNQATGTGLASSPNQSTITLQYDPAGNLTGNTGAIQSVYDAEGRLCATPINTGGYEGYIYDAEGNRVAKGTIQPVMVNGQTTLSCDTTVNGFALASQYLLGPSGEQMTELNATGAWVHTNVTANGSLLATFDNDNNGAHFYLTDWLGTRRVQTNYIGAVENTWTSLPYGDGLASSTNLDPTEQHFTGKERDTESGNDYFLARYYNSATGRFLSPDWSAKEDPVPYAHLDDPQSLNLYSYVLNNPLAKPDLDGHGCPPDCGDPTLPTAVAPPPPSLLDRFMDWNVKALNHPAVQAFLMFIPGIGPEAEAAGEIEAGAAEGAAASPGSIGANAAQGKAFEDAVAADTAQTNSNMVQHVTMKTQSGVKTVMDVVSKDASGETVLQEAKSSATARLTPAQKAAHPEIAKSGATVVGKGKPGFPGGTKIPPTTVQVVRPKPGQQ
jgi:RHS repeat-associated protein